MSGRNPGAYAVSMSARSPLAALLGPVRAVWRRLLPVAQSVRDGGDRALLTLRLAARRMLSVSNNVFSEIRPWDIPVFVINLQKRPDRLTDVRADLMRLGFSDIRVIVAVDGPEKYPTIARGHAANLGCTESHRAAVLEGLRPGQPIAVCEDDNEFLQSPEVVEKIISSFLRADEFDVLGVSVRVRGPKVAATEDLNVVAWALAPAFYIVKPRGRRALLASYRESVRRLSRERRNGPFDQVWKSAQRFRLIFATPVIRVARQKESHSDIQGKFFLGT